MGFTELEAAGKKVLEQFPVVKHAAKRAYQVVSVATNRDKVKSEGDVTRVSPDDGFEYFYGYYDKSPWDATDRYMICVRVQQAYKSVAPKEPGTVCLIDTANGNKVIEIGTTHSWNVQQSCMAQWMGPDFKSRIIYNDFRDGKYCSVVFNVEKIQEEKELPLPVYDVSRDGTFALSLDFNRLHRMRPGYGYSNLPDRTKGVLCPDECCIWKMDIDTGEVEELFKYTDFAAFEPDETMNGAEHKVNHLMISPNGKRFMVLHRWFDKGRKHTRLVTVNVDKTDMYNLSDDVFVSHCYWKNDEEILSFLRKKETGDHYYLMKDRTQEYKMYWPELNTDGHCSYSPDGQYIITDTYPNRKRIASVYLCTEEDNRSRRIARVFSPFKYDNDCRCDLHPRWNREGNKICIDSVHDGKRGLYLIGLHQDFNEEIEKKYAYTPKKKDINTAGLISRISAYDVVSFDIFDTLIKRDVPHPSDVFIIVARAFERKTGYKINDFKALRIEAERRAREKANKPEIKIEDIYDELHCDLSREEKQALMQCEIETEIRICCANKQVKEVYDYCIQERKKVLIISNMYLPESVITTILSNAGYTGYEKLYLSCVCNLKKSDGRLFKFAINDQHIKESDLIHIGDSWKADYIQAKRAGIQAIHIDKGVTHIAHTGKTISEDDRFDEACIRSFTNNHIDISKNEYYRFGYESFGRLLYGFNHWMIEELKAKGIHDVFFFSRDGHVIKQAFDIQNRNASIRSHYFYVSRRSLRVPQLWLNSEFEDVINVLPLAKLLTVETFIKNLGLEPEYYNDIVNKYNLTLSTMLKKVELKGNKRIRDFYEEIKEDVITHSKEECDIFWEYARQNGFQGRVAVVDIGWHGSLQYFIQKMADRLSLNLEMHGYYIGLATEAKRQIDIEGYVVDKGSTTGSCDSWKMYNGLVENLFLAQEGSTEKFKRSENGAVVPVLYPYEYEGEMGKKEWEAVKVANIQAGAISYVRDMAQTDFMDNIKITSAAAYANINETGMYPTKNDLRMFSDFRFMEEQVDYLAMPKGLIHYLFHPKQLKKDLGFCRWKIGFMKKLFVIPLPYVRMYWFLRKMTGDTYK